MWIVVEREFEFDHRPALGLCQVFRPALAPQQVTHGIGEHAVAMGFAKMAAAPKRQKKSG